MNEELTPPEHAAMRSTLLAGARRVKPVGAHRMQLIAAATALVLVAGVAAGAVAAASLFGSAEIAPVNSPSPSPTPTPSASLTPSPTPTRTEEPVSRVAVQPFGGVCANVIDSGALNDSYQADMVELPLTWPNPETVLAGGIDCLWGTLDGYMIPVLEVRAFPAAGQQDMAAQCDSAGPTCWAATTAGGAWIAVRAVAEGIDSAWMSEVAADIAQRAAMYPAPIGAGRQSNWWDIPECATVEAAFPAEWRDRIRPYPVYPSAGGPDQEFATARELAEIPYYVDCIWETRATDDFGGTQFVAMSATVVPGGGTLFDQIASTEDVQPQSVAGADAAVTVIDNHQWEKYSPALVVRDGADLLILRGDNWLPAEDLVPLAEAILAAL